MYGKSPFRHTKDAYLYDSTLKPHPYLLSEVIRKSGKKILDYGCGTGLYIKELRKRGFDCTGADINECYLEHIRNEGFKGYNIEDLKNLEDKGFDSTLLFDVLEHAEDPEQILFTVKRLTSRKIFISVPNHDEIDALIQHGLVYAHVLDLDHKHFFTYKILDHLLSKYFLKYRIQRIDLISLHPLIKYLNKLKLIRTLYFARLYVEVDLI